MNRLTEDDPIFDFEETDVPNWNQIHNLKGVCKNCGETLPSLFGRFPIHQLCDECNCEETDEHYDEKNEEPNNVKLRNEIKDFERTQKINDEITDEIVKERESEWWGHKN